MMILNIPDQIVSAYVCATVIFGGLIIMFGLLWCALFIGSKAIFELAAHCKFWREMVKVVFERIRAKSRKDAYPKG